MEGETVAGDDSDGDNGTPVRRLKPGKVLAWSEAQAEAGAGDGPFIALWLPEGVNVAIGLSQKPEVELEVETLRREGVGLVRRQSGGGAVLLYPGVLCWEAWAAPEGIENSAGGGSGIRDSYRFLCRPVIAGLGRLGLTVFQAGICDLSIADDSGVAARKMAGTAQLRKRRKVLVHGSLLVEPDVTLLGRYLKQPSEQPEYRVGRSHRDFCVTVAEALGDATAEGKVMDRVVSAVREAAQAEGWTLAAPAVALDGAAADLYAKKYADDAWNWEKKRQ